jgi:hypothetical protein
MVGSMRLRHPHLWDHKGVVMDHETEDAGDKRSFKNDGYC